MKDYHQPFFLITIDTEGDNLWSKPRAVTTRNADFIPRFQSLCESYGLKPTYLVDYEIAGYFPFQELGRDIVKRDAGEIGMHLHAWNTPPLGSLTKDDLAFQPYLIEYPPHIMRAKIAVMSDLLEDTFGIKMISHRAGRWSFNGTYAQILAEKEYKVDCSVTPHISWRDHLGDPEQNGGTDYSRFPEEAYFLDLKDPSRAGDSSLLEIPMTIMSSQKRLRDLLRRAFRRSFFQQRLVNRFFPLRWLRPNGKNLNDLLHILRQAIRDKRSYVEFMLHSSELMPGGSPHFPGAEDIEALYDDLEVLFCEVRGAFVGATLKEYYQKFVKDLNGKQQKG